MEKNSPVTGQGQFTCNTSEMIILVLTSCVWVSSPITYTEKPTCSRSGAMYRIHDGTLCLEAISPGLHGPEDLKWFTESNFGHSRPSEAANFIGKHESEWTLAFFEDRMQNCNSGPRLDVSWSQFWPILEASGGVWRPPWPTMGPTWEASRPIWEYGCSLRHPRATA